jgi:hypothetical protein
VGRVLLLSKSVLLMLTGEVVVVVVTIGVGSWRLQILPIPPSFRGVNTIEDVGGVDPSSGRGLRLASSVQMMLRLLRRIAR